MNDKNNKNDNFATGFSIVLIAAGLMGYGAYNMCMSFFNNNFLIAIIGATIAGFCTVIYGIKKIENEENEPSKASEEKKGCAKVLGIFALLAFFDMINDLGSKKKIK